MEKAKTDWSNATFGQRLAYARKQKGLSQKQFAELIGTNQTKLACWETDKRLSYVSFLPKITEFLGVSAEWLAGKDDNFSVKQSTEIKLTLKQQQLVADNADIILAVFFKLFKYNAVISYGDIYGDAAIALCKAAKIYDEEENHISPFPSFAFSVVKFKILNSWKKASVFYRRNTSFNRVIAQYDHGKYKELGELIPAPDEWETLEYKILAESVFQRLSPVLTVKEKEVFRPWLHGVRVSEIAKATGIQQHTIRTRMTTARKKCRIFFNPTDIFS